MINRIPKTHERVWNAKTRTVRGTFDKLRRRMTYKTTNDNIKKIHLHTFRHWKATQEQYKWKDVYKVRDFLGHVSVKSTEIYVHVTQMLYNLVKDDYVTKTATK